MYKLHSSPASVKTEKFGVAQNFTEVCFNVHGEGKWPSSTLQEPLPLQTKLSPLESPPAAQVHTKTADRISPGNFFHQHSSHGDTEAALRDSPYTLRWQSWTSVHFKVLHLQTKASQKKIVSIITLIVLKTSDNKKKCGLQVELLPTMKVWTFKTFNNIYRA